jgi:hypothetical protein
MPVCRVTSRIGSMGPGGKACFASGLGMGVLMVNERRLSPAFWHACHTFIQPCSASRSNRN